jgi:hypothetical protein
VYGLHHAGPITLTPVGDRTIHLGLSGGLLYLDRAGTDALIAALQQAVAEL